MSQRNQPRDCKKCGEKHAPPLIDDLCSRPPVTGEGVDSVDGAGAPEVMTEAQCTLAAVTSLAVSVKSMNDRVGSLEEIIKEHVLKKKKKKGKKKSKPRSDYTSTSPSSASSECDSAGEASDGSSDSVVSASAGDRSRSKSKKSSGHRSSAASLLRKSQFTHKPYIVKGKPVDRFERLMVCSLRMMKDIMASGTDVTGVLTHLIVLAEKAASGYYRVDSIIAYDRATRMTAAESGISKFSVIDNSLVLQHLCYDASVNASVVAKKGSEKQHKSSRSGGVCFRFNKSSGCEREKCRYVHVCSSCGDGSHGLSSCRKPRLQSTGGGAGTSNN